MHRDGVETVRACDRDTVIEIDLRDPDAKSEDTLADRIRLDPDQCGQLLTALQDSRGVLEKTKVERVRKPIRRCGP